MPKHKTKKTVTKKVRVTRNGKVVRGRTGASHLRSKKAAAARKRGTALKIEKQTDAPWNNLTK